jgi:flavorubredoxin
MDDFLRDLAAHNIQNRTVAIVENGTWGITAGKQMKEIIAGCRNMTILEPVISIKSALKEEQLVQLDAMAEALAAGFTAAE